jgi:hypothetical protein
MFHSFKPSYVVRIRSIESGLFAEFSTKAYHNRDLSK